MKVHFLLRSFLVSLGLVLAADAGESGGEDKPLNVLMILADDLGWSDTTLMGESELYETPNLDRLAKRGMTFRQAYAASPLCSPTRASILTGQTPARHGITAPTAHIKPKKKPAFRASVAPSTPPGSKASVIKSVGPLNPELPTLGKLIREAGYTTGHFGKWHLGHPPHSPLEHGFDVDIPHWPGPGPGGSFIAPWKYPHYDEGKPGEHIEDRMAAEAANWIKKQAESGKPFYAQYWQFSVHAPFDAKPELIRKYAGRVEAEGGMNQGQRSPTYAAMVESLDDAVGTLLDALDEAGVADETLIIFYSDNGGNEYNVIFERDSEGEGFLARPTDNAPLRGGKATIYEGGIRVPAVVVWPGVVQKASRSEARIQSTDLYPTILNALGIKLPQGHIIDGIDIADALTGNSINRPGGMVTYFPHNPGVPDWLPPSVAVHDGDWKLIRIFHEGDEGAHRYMLFNLKEDIGETTNVAAKHPMIVKRMDEMIERHLKAADAVVPVPNPKFDPAVYKPELIGVQKPGGAKLAAHRMSAKDRKEGEALLEKELGKMVPDSSARILFKGEPEVVSKGHEFAEGMAFDAGGNFYFTDVPSGKLFKIDAKTGEKSLFDGDTGKTNGIAMGPDGMLYGCSGGANVIHCWDLKTGEKTVIAEGPKSNDIAITKNGTIYFSDPASMAIYMVSPAPERKLTTAVQLEWKPNGIGLHPNEDALMVAEFFSDTVHRFPIAEDGSLGKSKPAYKLAVTEDGKGFLDGMVVLPSGKLLIGTSRGIQLVTPLGEKTPRHIITPSFGERPRCNYVRLSPDGKWLYAAFKDDLVRMPLREGQVK